ncbi:MAG: DinB family protein [Luteitalea sp.]|nr:DinB family protein [Luteitalea sp.]
MVRLLIASAPVLLFAVTAPAQPIPKGQKIGLARYLQAGYSGLKMNLTRAADKMPAADYDSKPSSMPEVRSYGQIFAHVADGQFTTCAAINGVPNPNQSRNLEQELKTKAAFVKALADSFAFCDDAFASLTDANAMESVKQGQGEVAKAAALVGLLAHGAEMYGISTVYLRAKNLVPPSSEQ